MAKALAIAIFLLLVSSVVTAADKPAENTLLPTSPPPHVHPPLRSIPRSLLSLPATVGKVFNNMVPKFSKHVKKHHEKYTDTVGDVLDAIDEKNEDQPKPNSVPFSSHSPIAHYYISFEGFVSVKSCKYANSPNIPVRGAVVGLKCNGVKKFSQVTTDRHNGHFYLEAPKNISTTNGPHNCIVFVPAPNSTLYTPPILKSGGVNGNMTVQKTTSHGARFLRFNVGTLAFCSTLN